MTKKIIQKACGLAMSAIVALTSVMSPVSEAWAEDAAALAGAGAGEAAPAEAGEGSAPADAPVLYWITIPDTQHLIVEPEKEHIHIPDPDIHTEEEKKDTILSYEAGEIVEIGICAEDTWQITRLSFLDEKKEETAYGWKDETTVSFQMPDRNLIMEAELTELVIPEEALQEGPQNADAGEGMIQQPMTEAGLPLQAEPQNHPAGSDMVSDYTQDTGSTENAPQDAGTEEPAPIPEKEENPSQVYEDETVTAPEGNQRPSEADMGPEQITGTDSESGTSSEGGTELTYIPEKEADGLPAQGSIEQTQTLEIRKNDAGFDARIDLSNIPYDPEQYSIEYISDDILPDTVGTYSCIYKVTVPDSGKFFFVLRPVKVVEETVPPAPAEQKEAETSTQQEGQGTVSTEAGSGTPSETEPGPGQQTETMESTTETTAETGMTSETETAAETETEETEAEETETEEPSGEYKVTITEGEDLGVELDHEDGTYDDGETVTFTAKDAQNILIAAAALKEESNRTENTADILYSEVSYNEGQDSFSFEMPAENVSLAVRRDEELGRGIKLMAASGDDDETWDDATDVEAGSYYYFSDGKLHPFNNDMGSGGNDSYKYVRYKVDGVTYTVNAYCMQHSETAPPSGTTYSNMTELDEGGDDKYLRKAIFYGYGGPGWGGTFNGYSIKKIMKDDYGCGSETRAMQHYIVDYLYDGESGFGGALSDKAKQMIKEVKAALKEMPDPAKVSLTPGLSTTSTGAKTPSFKWNADPAYKLTVTLESGVELVNETTGARSSGSGTVSGGQSFHLEATGNTANLKGKYPLSCNYPFDFHAMLLKLKNSQDIGFGYYTEGKGLEIDVEWEISRPFEVQKYDAVTGQAAPYGPAYSFNGMQVTVYRDAGLTKVVEKIMTDAKGHGKSSDLPYGTYYARETAAPTGYKIMDHTFTVVIGDKVTVDGAATGTVRVVDDSIRKKISVQKYDKKTGKPQPYNQSVSFNGAEYTIYSDSGCTKAVTKITTNQSGYAQTDFLPVADYYVKETKAPHGYQADPTIHHVPMDFTGTVEVYPVNSTEKSAEKPFEVQKYDKDTGKAEPYNSRYSFAGMEITVYEDAALTKPVDTIVTDAAGHGKSTPLAYGTYYARETKPPMGYKPMDHTFTVVIGDTVTVDGAETGLVRFVDEIIRKPFEVQKYDRDTGKAEPYNRRYSFAGMEITVYEDAALTKPVDKIVTDAAGHGKSTPLAYGTYYARETKPPMGYKPMDHTFTVDIGNEIKIDGAAAGTAKVVNEIIRKKLGIQKHDKEIGKAEPYNSLVSFKDTEYTIYTDEACTHAVATIRTNAKGYAESEPLPVETYYLKETKRPNGYEMDQTVHAVTSDFDETVQVHVAVSSEQVIRKPIEIQKYDKDTGKPEPNNIACTFEGAEYTIYSDQACTKALEVLTLNAAGYAKSAKKYVIETYYLKETKPPRGYNIDKNVYVCNVEDDGSREKNDFSKLIHIDSVDEVIKGNVSIMKYFDEDVTQATLQDWINNAKLKGIRFTLTHEDPKVPQLTLTTDKYGFAETPKRSMVYGTWTIAEDPATTPETFDILEGANFKIEVEAETLRYVVTNQLISIRLQINKRDADTGSMIPIRGAKFQILGEDGKAITMPDNLDYSKMTDTFTTNEEGVIVLTSRLPYGTYTIKEVWAPDGYLLSDAVKVTLNKKNADNKTNFVVEFKDKPQMGRLRMTKIDKDTGETIGEGFTFDVFTADAITDAAGVPYTMDVEGKEVTLDKAGVKAATVVTDENGLAVTGALHLGKYVVKEVGSAEYYALNPAEYPAEILFDREVVDVDVDLQVPNEKTKFDLFKVDSEQEDLPLAGITFRIFSSSDKDAEKARQVAEAVEAKRKEQQPLKDDFIEKQAKALEAFSKKEGVSEEDIASYRENQEREALDYEASLEAECTELEKALMITLEITDTSMLGAEYVTDEHGQIHVEDLLHENTYTIYETKTLPGYNLDTTIHEFTVDKHGLINGESRYTLTLANVPNNVDISKKDITGNDELPGATLTVKDAEENVIDFWVSEETPHRMKALPAGIYTLTEEQAPEGYALAEDITFTVTDSLEIQTVTMYDEKLEIHFSKKDITGEEELPGAHLSVTDVEGNAIEEWVSGEEEHVINLKVGTYTLTETAPPDKYATAESVTFEVKDDMSVQKVEMLDAPLVVEISKSDITTGKELPGAHMTITDKDGTVVEEWDSSEEPHKVTLSQGDYVLTEVAAPSGFARAESVAFTVTDTAEIQKVEMKDKPIEVEISKQDIMNGQELPGAHLIITDREGNTMEEWTSTDKPHKMNLPAGEYILTEITAPEGYFKAENVSFTITDTGDVQKVEMKDKPMNVEISKQDITDGKELPGAQLTITDQFGETVEEWTSTDEPHVMYLPVGEYTLTEVAAPEKYSRAESITFTVTLDRKVEKVEMKDKPIEVEISKQDITNGQELPGAQLTITDKDGKTVEEWTSTDKPHMVNLPAGEYTLTEVAAPERYAKAESISFIITDTMEVQKVEMKDKPIEVEVSKKDITNDEELPGAHLIIKDKDGKTVEEWTSTDVPHMVNLPAGEYTLTEVTAPKGYDVAETVSFTVTDSMEIQHVQMYDSPKDSVIDLTGKKKKTTKETKTGNPGTPGIPGTSAPGTTVTASPVLTGDFNRYLVPLAIFGAGAALLALLLILKKRDAKRTGKKS